MKKWIAIFLFLNSCVIPYDFTQDSYRKMLVIEAYVSDRPGDHRVYLSWSGEFDQREFEMVDEAEVSVFENEVLEHSFSNAGNGLYTCPDSSFVATGGNTYVLEIRLNDRLYRSDEVSILPCAGIDTLEFVHDQVSRPGERYETRTILLQVSTLEDPDAARHYRYTKEETWLTIAPESRNKKIQPIFRVEDGLPVDVSWDITEFENITYCWPRAESRGIALASTEGLSENRVERQVISSVNLYSNKLLYKYSALIRQYSLDNEAHHFLSLMKEFSEGDGTLFEVQPGFVEGNIHPVTDPGEQVVGIFYASQVEEARIFIRLNDLDPYYRAVVIQNARNCESEQVLLPMADSIPDSTLTAQLVLLRDSMMAKRMLVISDIIPGGLPGSDVVKLSNNYCVDCRGNGTNVKPEWWGDIY